MELYELFYKWVPRPVSHAILFILLLVILSANGIYQGITVDMYSGLGEYTEFLSMASNSMFIGMGVSMMFTIRMASRFSNKQLIVTGLISMLLLTIGCALTTDPIIIIACSFAIGFTKVFALGHVYLKWLSVWSSKMDSSRLYPFLFFVALSGSYLFSWLATSFAYSFNWQYAYLLMLLLLLASLMLAILFVENHPLRKRIPLYQMDIPGMILLCATLMLVNYITVFGNVEDWLGSNRIIIASLFSVITLLLFIKREINQKRPLLDLNFFKKTNFVVGLFLFGLLGIFTPPTFQSAFTSGVLHIESIRSAEINLFIIPGIVAGAVLCYFWYKEKFNGQLMIIAGFSSMVIYHAVLYFSFAKDFELNDLWIASMVKGFALALLYISVGLYTTNGFPFKSVLKVVGAVIIVRSFLGGSLFSGLYGYHLSAYRLNHVNYLASSHDANEWLSQSGGLAELTGKLQGQALIEASKELSGLIVIAGITLISILALLFIHQKLRKHPLFNGDGLDQRIE